MNECEKYEALISSLIDSEISEEDKSALAQHLESCPRCRAMYESFMAVSRLISDELEDVPEGLHENIMAEVRRENIKKKNKKGLSGPLKTLIATAACAAIIVGVSFGLIPDAPTSQAPESYSMAASEEENSDYGTMEASVLAEEPADEESAAAEIPADGADDTEAEGENTGARKKFTAAVPSPALNTLENTLQAEESPDLSVQKFDALLALVGENIADADTEAVRASDIMIDVFCEDGRSIVFYDYDSSLCYMLSSSDSVYKSVCEYSDILDFLNQNA